MLLKCSTFQIPNRLVNSKKNCIDLQTQRICSMLLHGLPVPVLMLILKMKIVYFTALYSF